MLPQVYHGPTARSSTPKDGDFVLRLNLISVAGEIAFAGWNGDRQPVLGGRERAMPAAIVGAGWIVGEIEVNHEATVGLPKVGMLDRIKQIAAAAVGSITIGLVAKRQKDTTAVAENPEERERDCLPANLKVNAPEALDTHHAIMFQRNLAYLRLHQRIDRQQKAKRGIIIVVAQAIKAMLLCLR